MFNFLTLLQVISIIIPTLAAVIEILKFVNPPLANKIREWLPEFIKRPVVSHVLFLLVGIILGISLSQKSTTDSTESSKGIYKEYEWQWAGENWYGRVTLENIGGKNVVTQARVGSIEKTVTPGAADVIRINGMVIELIEGSFNILNNNQIEVNLSVNKKNRRTDQIDTEVIKGVLQKNTCYAGTVTYTTDEGSFEGDMILNEYISSVGNVVNDWFRETNPSWFSYGK